MGGSSLDLQNVMFTSVAVQGNVIYAAYMDPSGKAAVKKATVKNWNALFSQPFVQTGPSLYASNNSATWFELSVLGGSVLLAFSDGAYGEALWSHSVRRQGRAVRGFAGSERVTSCVRAPPPPSAPH